MIDFPGAADEAVWPQLVSFNAIPNLVRQAAEPGPSGDDAWPFEPDPSDDTRYDIFWKNLEKASEEHPAFFQKLQNLNEKRRGADKLAKRISHEVPNENSPNIIYTEYDDYSGTPGASKRSGLRAALMSGRRRRGPALHAAAAPAPPAPPAPGKAVTPYIGVGLLSDMERYFASLRSNMRTIATLPPAVREAMLREEAEPAAVRSQGAASRRPATAALLHALHRDHRLRSYDRRSLVEEPEPAEYRNARYHDPALLWAGLGRRRR